MTVLCQCQMPPFHYLGFNIVELGEDYQGEATLQTCTKCNTVWLKYLLEEPHYTDAGRWWRVEVQPNEVSSLSMDTVKKYVESKEVCFVGGCYYKNGIHKKVKPIRVR